VWDPLTYFGPQTTCNPGTSDLTQTAPAKLYGYLDLDIAPRQSQSDAHVLLDPLRFPESTYSPNEIDFRTGAFSNVYRPSSQVRSQTGLSPASCSKHDSGTTQKIDGRVRFGEPFIIDVDCARSGTTSEAVPSTFHQIYKIVFTQCPRRGLDVKHC